MQPQSTGLCWSNIKFYYCLHAGNESIVDNGAFVRFPLLIFFCCNSDGLLFREDADRVDRVRVFADA